MKRLISKMWRDERLHSVADQAVVSATNFLSFVFLTRLAAPEDVGVYAACLSVVAVATAAQDALVSKPFAINIARPIGGAREQAFVALCLGGLFGASLGLFGLLLGSMLAFAGLDHSTAAAILILAVTGPMLLQRELVRKYLLAKLRPGSALLLDACYAVGTIGGLASLYPRGELHAGGLLLLTGAVGLVVTMGWLYAARRNFAVSLANIRAVIQRFWATGKYFLGGHMALQAQAYVATWLVLGMTGKAAAGIYAACVTLAGLSNPFLYGYANIMMPKFVHLFHDEGASALRRRAVVESAVLGGVMAGFCAVMFVFASELMRLLYANGTYDAYAEISRILAFAALVGSLGIAPSLALTATGNARMAASIMVASTTVNLMFVVALLPGWGLRGAAYGLLAGEIVSAIGRWAVFLKCVPATQPALNLART
jgi:O-antigen/teichoic acid export membrane protein